MVRVGPFEAAPHIAVAVSGGPDSMALVLLAVRWAKAAGGQITALTVDHGLRAESGAEARQVAAWLRARSIEYKILRWQGPKPDTGVQAAARDARIQLLLNWCSRAGPLHLLYAHQQEDQAVTLLQRLAHGSGPDGLAAMPLVHVRPHGHISGVRLLRPLLDVPRHRLMASLEEAGQRSIEDPSNKARQFARARLEKSFPSLAAEGLSVDRLARLASRAGEDRAALDLAVADWLGRHASPHPAGFVTLDHHALRDVPKALCRRILSRLIQSVGGGTYPPRSQNLAILMEALQGRKFSGRTLGGCRVTMNAARLLICREPGAIKDEITLSVGQSGLWDSRFYVRVTARRQGEEQSTANFSLRRLGRAGIAEARAIAGNVDIFRAIPAPVRPSLPAFFDLDGLVALPHIKLTRSVGHGASGDVSFTVSLRPMASLTVAEFSGLTN
jgi:tRNA(Ile)-lysidine synthase